MKTRALALIALVALGTTVALVGTSGAATSRPAVKVKSTSLGKILVDSKGRTLYMFGADSRNKSNCSDACASNWPPAAGSAKPKAGPGVSARRLKTIKRSDGIRQLVYNGHPLYRYVGDAKAGDMNGQGINAFGGVWNVVSPKGKAITTSPSSSSPPPSQPTSPGYGYPPY